MAGATPGDYIENDSDRMGSFTMTNCYWHQIGVRVMIEGIQSGTFTHNTFDGVNGGLALVVDPYWAQGGTCQNVTVSNNVFRDCNLDKVQGSGALVMGPYWGSGPLLPGQAYGFENFTVTHNTFTGPTLEAIHAHGVGNLNIAHNFFSVGKGVTIHLDNCGGEKVLDNKTALADVTLEAAPADPDSRPSVERTLMHFQAIAFALVACVLVSAFASGEVNGQASARVTVSLEPLGVEVPQSFLGFAPEYNAWKNMGVGDFFDPRNGEQATSIRLLNRLGDYNGPPSVRIGGYSQDKAWWDPDGAPYLPTDKIRFDITPEWVKNVRAIVEGTHCRLILGLNLGFNRPEAAAEWARVALEIFPEGCIEAFEIGNEPDAFIPQKARTTPWTFEMFCEDFERFTQHLRPLIPPGIPLAGPAAANSYEWRTKDFIERFHAQIGLVTLHKYIFQPWMEDTSHTTGQA